MSGFFSGLPFTPFHIAQDRLPQAQGERQLVPIKKFKAFALPKQGEYLPPIPERTPPILLVRKILNRFNRHWGIAPF
jgi:hypothetical protein